MTTWAEGDINNQGMNLHYYRTGDSSKPPLLLAHGLTDNGLCWSRFAQAMQSQYDVVMLDARNHGQSSHAPATLAQLASDMAAVVQQLGLDAANVVGHSVGASIAAGFAASYPQLVSKLVLEDPPWLLGSKGSTPSSKRIKAFHDFVVATQALPLTKIKQQGQHQHPTWAVGEFDAWAIAKQQVAAGALAALDLGDWRSVIPGIQCPTLVLYAADSDDGMLSHDAAAEVSGLNSNMNCQHVPGAGHNLRRQQFELFLGAVREFFEVSL